MMPFNLYVNMLLRFMVIILFWILMAKPINREYYDNFYSKALLKIHTTDLRFFSDQLRTRLSYYLLMNDIVSLQNILDSNFGAFGFVITDCASPTKACSGQKIIHTSSRSLDWLKFPTETDLERSQYILLEGAAPLSGGKPEIIGRLYVITNIPLSFDEDYSMWMRSPFKKIGPWNYYLRTMEFCLLGGLLVWTVIELLLLMRRNQIRSTRQREYELMANADSYLKLLEAKNAQLEEHENSTRRQYQVYLDRIRELEQRVTNDSEYQKLTESVIRELEEAKEKQLARLTEELNKTQFEMDILRNKIAALDSVSRKDTPDAPAATHKYSNVFEQRLFETIFRTPKYARGEWRIINSFNVAAGKSHSQFTDCILLSKDCIIVLEAKNYTGVIESDGDSENAKWYSVDGTSRREIVSLWGDNPFHQVNEYCMSLLRLVQKRSAWNMSVYGIIVFPAGADLSMIGSNFGRFYRVVTLDRLTSLLDKIEAEARRHNAFSKRPTPNQIEDIIRGRAVGTV